MDFNYSPDGYLLAVATPFGELQIFDTRSLIELDRLVCGSCFVHFDGNGSLLTSNKSGLARWDFTPVREKNGEFQMGPPVYEAGSVASAPFDNVAFSPDGRMIAISDSTSRINFFNPSNGRKIFALTDPNDHLANKLAFNPNGRQLAVFSSSSVVHLWDLAAMNEELMSLGLDWGNDQAATKHFDSDDSKITALQIVADQRFVEIEASQQSDLLREAIEKFDMFSARAAIARIIKLQPNQALTCNNFAWVLATGPQPLRDPVRAVEFARRAITDESVSQTSHANHLNTLGIALFRENKLEEATEILLQSLAAQQEDGKPYDLYFLSMCSSRTGDHAKASSYFETAESMADQVSSRMTPAWKNEIAQFAEEAKLLLKNHP